MSKMLKTQPDGLPLREVLRGLRHIVRRSGEAARDLTNAIADSEADGSVMNQLASTFIAEMEHLAASVDDAASRAARRALGVSGEVTATLPQVHEQGESCAPLAAALYTTLGMVLERMRAEHLFVSEMAAREAVVRWQRHSGSVSDSRLAADLALALADQRVIRGSPAHGDIAVQVSQIVPVAITSVVLWFLVARAPNDSEAALASAADVCVALAARIEQAFSAGDAEMLTALLQKYRNNV